MDQETEDLIQKIDSFFDKKGVALESKFLITRRMSQQYEDDLWDDDEEEPEDGVDDAFEDDFEPDIEAEAEDEPAGEDLEEEEDLEVPDSVPPLEVPKPPAKKHQNSMKAKMKRMKPKAIKE